MADADGGEHRQGAEDEAMIQRPGHHDLWKSRARRPLQDPARLAAWRGVGHDTTWPGEPTSLTVALALELGDDLPRYMTRM
jgi:hypothetical protein